MSFNQPFSSSGSNMYVDIWNSLLTLYWVASLQKNWYVQQGIQEEVAIWKSQFTGG